MYNNLCYEYKPDYSRQSDKWLSCSAFEGLIFRFLVPMHIYVCKNGYLCINNGRTQQHKIALSPRSGAGPLFRPVSQCVVSDHGPVAEGAHFGAP